MTDKKKNPRPSRDARELLREAVFAPDDSNPDEARAGADDVPESLGERSRLLAGFAARLEAEAQMHDGDAARALDSVLQRVRTELDQHRASSQSEQAESSATTRARGTRQRYWTNTSVQALVGQVTDDDEPVRRITQQARDLIFEYVQEGGATDPVDPFKLARFRKLQLEPYEDVRDARTVRTGNRFVIQFNPDRPPVRIRFSICHEIIHTLFPDCADRVRYRATHEKMSTDEWQLESLCDVGAAELLMPVGSLTDVEHGLPTISELLSLRKRLEVSVEALLIRVAKLTAAPCFVFSASRNDRGRPRFKVDYTIRSRAFGRRVPVGLRLPVESIVAGCQRPGDTDEGTETWHPDLGELRVGCVAIYPYPDSVHPRVMGIAVPVEGGTWAKADPIHYVKGDVTRPRGAGLRIVAQVVNDKAEMWGGGFALVVRRRWPEIQKDFAAWARADRNRLALGNSHFSSIDDSTGVFNMVCQHGYAPTPKPSIRYRALKTCLDALAGLALETGATVHMPRIGCGQAGGNWNIVSELIVSALCDRGIKVTVYDLPGTEFVERQRMLF